MNGSFDADEDLKSELDSGEQVVWSQQVGRLKIPLTTLIPAVIGVIWIGISLFITFAAANTAHSRAPFSARLLPILPVLIAGLVFTVVPLYRLIVSIRSYYLITNRRALIVTLGKTRQVLSYYPGKLQSIERRERKDGRGDIIFDRRVGNSMGGAPTLSSRYAQEIGFMNIADVREVERMLRRLAESKS